VLAAVCTQFTAEDVRQRGDLGHLRAAIEAVIPLSAGNYNTEIYDDETKTRIGELRQKEGHAMADAVDLVEIKHTLRQIVNVKGD
jgi:hypothetical protein